MISLFEIQSQGHKRHQVSAHSDQLAGREEQCVSILLMVGNGLRAGSHC